MVSVSGKGNVMEKKCGFGKRWIVVIEKKWVLVMLSEGYELICVACPSVGLTKEDWDGVWEIVKCVHHPLMSTARGYKGVKLFWFLMSCNGNVFKELIFTIKFLITN